MYTSMWFVSIVAILVVDVRTGALLQKDTVSQQCYQCANNGSACLPAPCPARGRRCATVASAPDFTSTLTCATSTARPCSLVYSKQILHLTCTCPGNRCNAPFTAQLTDKLIKFTANISNLTQTNLDITDKFLKSLGNISSNKLYEMITVKSVQGKLNSTQLPVHVISTTKTNVEEHLNDINLPRAEALKHEATEPSDDEEDESEGSGSYEETRLRRPASAPAAPSSFLPANENMATPVLINFLLLTTTLFVTL